MATTDLATRGKLVAIAPVPASGVEPKPLQPPMAHSCRTCAMRKVKCDKAAPTCSTCSKAKLECVYQPLAPRRRKRKSSANLDHLTPHEKLARYERILQQLGVLEAEPPTATSPPTGEAQDTAQPNEQEKALLRFVPWGHSQISQTGKLLADQGRSRYIDSDLWRDLGHNEDDAISEDEDEDEHLFRYDQFLAGNSAPDPLTGTFLGCNQQSLLHYHPTHADAMILWHTHVNNVEPIIKILHIPSVTKMVKTVSQQPGAAHRTEECLLFTIYHFAVFSMTEEECIEKLGQPRVILRQQYHFAARQALVNAGFLKTTEMSVLQALVLFLMPCRHSYDPHTFWILTGVAVRIAQRMGIHHDGSKLGLSPFEVQMRRRLFYQLLPLDATASQTSGVGMTMPPSSWDTEPALNINDDQIWPGMIEAPEEQRGATEMMFCLSRFCIGMFISKAGKRGNGELKDHDEADRVIGEAESEVEEKYIRYCDVINPLHFLTIGLARSGITAMRLRVRLPRAKNQIVTDAERKEMVQLAQKILDTDSAAHAHESLMKKFGWHVGVFFLWGTWDSLVFLLTTLWTKPDLLTPSEIKAAWDRIEQVYRNHPELLDTKRALHVAFQRLTIKAWEASRSDSSDLATTLRSLRQGNSTKNNINMSASSSLSVKASDASLGENLASAELLGSDFGGNDFDLDPADWTFWDRLIQSDRPGETEDVVGQYLSQ